jgi:hypothetical protein
MSRDYQRRSRSRSRDRRQSDDRSHQGSEYNRKERGELAPSEPSWGDKFKAQRTSSKPSEEQLADEFGYSTAGWDHSATGVSMGLLSASAVTEQDSIPPPPPKRASAEMSESNQWGYEQKPYVPSTLPLSIPLLSNPVAHVPPPPPLMQVSGAHIVLENVPGDLNLMSLIYEHFKQFGEVVSVHCIQKYNKALIDFKSRDVAERAASEQVLGVPSIKASVFSGPARGIGRTAPSTPLPGKATPPPAQGLTKNLVFESDAARKAREKREQQIEADKKRNELLTAYTEHVKQIVAKMADKTIKEEVRAKYQEMLDHVKGKINDIQKIENERRRKESEAMQKALAIRYKAYEKQARIDSNKRQQELTLDLRSRCVRISDLPEELAQSVVLVEYLRAMGMKELNDVIWLENRTSAVLRFGNHAAADQLVKHELAFKAEWVSNEEAAGLANFNQVEQVEITPLDEEEEASLLTEQ